MTFCVCWPCLPSHAFESDVHFGLTRWLALQAGYTDGQAQAIATGNQRVDAGDVQFVELLPLYACVAPGASASTAPVPSTNASSASGANGATGNANKITNKATTNLDSATLVLAHHYPGTTKLPAPPEQRVVQAGGDAARAAANEVLKMDASKAGFTLYKLGEALHVLQDSWAHQGQPDVAQPLPGALACDRGLAWSPPAARGGWATHRSSLTAAWPADTLAMAQASYEVLQRYPRINGVARQAVDWAQLRPQLDGFAAAKTKARKLAWFAAHGMADGRFLAATSLPDGAQTAAQTTAQAVDRPWDADKLPRLANVASQQVGVDPGLLDFFNRLVVQWTGSEDFAATAKQFGPAAGAPVAQGALPAQLAARLRLWRLHDHGSVADLAHQAQPLSAAQLAALDAVARKPGAYARYAVPAHALVPYLPKTVEAAPLLPFVLQPLPPGADGRPRAVAVLKFRHAPYDTVTVLAEQAGGRWAVAAVSAVVDP